MAAKKTTPKVLGEMLGYVVKHMATKDDLAAVEVRLDKRIDKLEHRLDRVEAKIDRLDTKLTKFEESEIDKRTNWKSASRSSKSISASTRKSPPNRHHRLRRHRPVRPRRNINKNRHHRAGLSPLNRPHRLLINRRNLS